MNKIYKAFPGGKHKVLTMSYDDGKIADRRLVEIFNRYGIRGTFNLNSDIIQEGIRIPWNEWPELYKGHEIAVHTSTHPTIDRCPNTEIISEIFEDRKKLEAIMGYPVRGMAYPNGSSSPRVARIASDLGIKYGRTVNDQFASVHLRNLGAAVSEGPIMVGDENGFNFPDDYMQWKPTCHHNHHLIQFGTDFLSLKKTQYLYMMYVWGHSFEFDRDDNWNIMEKFCEMMSTQDDIWYATNIEIVDYMEVFARLQFAADMSFVYNPSATSGWLVVNDKNIVEVKAGEILHF